MKRVVAIVLSLALAGCDYSPPGPPVEEAVGAPLDAPRVSVTAPGDGQQQVMAFTDIDSAQEVSVAVSEGFNQDVIQAAAADGFHPSVATAAVTLPLNIEVTPASDAASGQAPATRNVFAKVQATPDIPTAEGFQFGWRAVDSGQASSLRLAAPKQASDEDRAAAEQAILKLVAHQVVFPTDPIAPGATWTVESRVTGDNTLLQTTTYRLVSYKDNQATLDVDISQRPSLGALQLADGQSVDVLNTQSESTGTLTVDLTKPLPVAGEVDVTTTVIYGQKDAAVRVIQTTATKVRFS
ncbi:hypothetical protein CPHO_04370 [Corynebacterium phocae]|uniref:Uncharacterized protein n=1 Tax=Corynebacterium phocae TaxID=161895 RepID=A0A1L7D2F2_9CORY|nr:DUF6263 family protein [Corynebacterium phocae]APT92253.1 hypothetical protein CPHO_04370 [Corynebacterium phocae]KAA8725395.1 hypothetical protein F4V58_03920 [Corynebacterium phocae]